MTSDNPPSSPDVPDLQTLLKATGIALVVAIVVLVVAVLPAEYGVDPTGIGAATGLTDLNQAPEGPGFPVHESTHTSFQVDTVHVTIPAGEGLEYKLQMEEGSVLLYRWNTTDILLTYDLHGEREDARPGEFTSYDTGEVGYAAGRLIAPFTGTHGWYWENPTDADVTVTLHTSGGYEVLGVR